MPLPTSTNLDNMSSALVTILGTVKDPNLLSQAAFQQVTDYPTNNFDATPAATVFPAGAPSDYLDTANNLRGYGFWICIYLDVSGRTNAQIWTTMRKLVDATLDAIDRSLDLNGTADILRATPLDWYTEETEQGNYVVCPLKLLAQKMVEVQ